MAPFRRQCSNALRLQCHCKDTGHHGIIPPPPEQWGGSNETFRIFCGHASFPEMNGGISVYEETKPNNHKEGGR